MAHSNPLSASPVAPSPPWWKFGHVWLVISGPAIVVVASFITFYLAAVGQDPVIEEDYYRKGIEINKTLRDNPTSLAPATQARNHAATGVKAPR
nr:FixH family protein [Rhodoferax sp.]